MRVGHIRKPAPGLAQQRPLRAAAERCRRGGADRVRATAGDPSLRRRLEADGTPAVVEELREAVRSADAVSWPPAEYNHSLPAS